MKVCRYTPAEKRAIVTLVAEQRELGFPWKKILVAARKLGYQNNSADGLQKLWQNNEKLVSTKAPKVRQPDGHEPMAWLKKTYNNGKVDQFRTLVDSLSNPSDGHLRYNKEVDKKVAQNLSKVAEADGLFAGAGPIIRPDHIARFRHICGITGFVKGKKLKAKYHQLKANAEKVVPDTGPATRDLVNPQRVLPINKIHSEQVMDMLPKLTLTELAQLYETVRSDLVLVKQEMHARLSVGAS